MRVKILGSRLGGFPQWNCGCANCRRLREGTLRGRGAPRRRKIAFSPESRRESLVPGFPSPDLRAQILATPELGPQSKSRNALGRSRAFSFPRPMSISVMGPSPSPRVSIFFRVRCGGYSTHSEEGKQIFGVLDRAESAGAMASPLEPRDALAVILSEKSRRGAGIRLRYAAPRGSYPDYASEELQRTLSPDDATLGFVFRAKGKELLHGAVPLRAKLGMDQKTAASSDLVLIDGTFWSDDN